MIANFLHKTVVVSLVGLTVYYGANFTYNNMYGWTGFWEKQVCLMNNDKEGIIINMNYRFQGISKKAITDTQVEQSK